MQINNALPAPFFHPKSTGNEPAHHFQAAEPVAEFIPAPRRTVLHAMQSVQPVADNVANQQAGFIRMLGSLEREPLPFRQHLPPAVLAYIQVSALNVANHTEHLIDEMV